VIERHSEEPDQQFAGTLKIHERAVTGLAEVPGPGADSARQIIAEVGPQAEVFPRGGADALLARDLCPGQEESAEKSQSDRSPQGNRPMRRVLNQAANARSEGQRHCV
jgi:transposase